MFIPLLIVFLILLVNNSQYEQTPSYLPLLANQSSCLPSTDLEDMEQLMNNRLEKWTESKWPCFPMKNEKVLQKTGHFARDVRSRDIKIIGREMLGALHIKKEQNWKEVDQKHCDHYGEGVIDQSLRRKMKIMFDGLQ
ncbi:hypothetical protein Tco_0174600 [Tanacetum coccineum]